MGKLFQSLKSLFAIREQAYMTVLFVTSQETIATSKSIDAAANKPMRAFEILDLFESSKNELEIKSVSSGATGGNYGMKSYTLITFKYKEGAKLPKEITKKFAENAEFKKTEILALSFEDDFEKFENTHLLIWQNN